MKLNHLHVGSAFQLFDRESCTYTYLLADNTTREAVLIDPVIELANRDKDVLNDLGLKLKYCSECICLDRHCNYSLLNFIDVLSPTIRTSYLYLNWVAKVGFKTFAYLICGF
jgi:hypothetical protein